jgi:hypothetical protein
MLELPMRIFHLIVPFSEHAHGGEALDVMRSAEVHFSRAIHLRRGSNTSESFEND